MRVKLDGDTPPSRASLRLARAVSRASARETSSTLPRARRDAIFRMGTDLGKDRPVTAAVYDRPKQERAVIDCTYSGRGNGRGKLICTGRLH